MQCTVYVHKARKKNDRRKKKNATIIRRALGNV